MFYISIYIYMYLCWRKCVALGRFSNSSSNNIIIVIIVITVRPFSLYDVLCM